MTSWPPTSAERVCVANPPAHDNKSGAASNNQEAGPHIGGPAWRLKGTNPHELVGYGVGVTCSETLRKKTSVLFVEVSVAAMMAITI